MSDYETMTPDMWQAVVQALGPEKAEAWRQRANIPVQGMQPSQPAGGSATVPPTTPLQGLASMDGANPETPQAADGSQPVGALGAVEGMGGMAPTAQDWTEYQKRAEAAAAQSQALRQSQFAEGQQLIQKMYGGPSTSDRLWALSRALLSPTRYRGFAGTLANVSDALGGMQGQQEDAARKRAEALLTLKQSYATAADRDTGDTLKLQLEMLKARQAAGKPVKARTGFNPVTGKLMDMDTGLPITPPPPRVGEVREGHMYVGGEPSSPNSWKKVM